MLFSLAGDLSDFWLILIDSSIYIINSLRQDFSGAFVSGLSLISLDLIVMYPVVSVDISLGQWKYTRNICLEFIDRNKKVLSMLFKDD